MAPIYIAGTISISCCKIITKRTIESPVVNCEEIMISGTRSKSLSKNIETF